LCRVIATDWEKGKLVNEDSDQVIAKLYPAIVTIVFVFTRTTKTIGANSQAAFAFVILIFLALTALARNNDF